MKQKIYSTMLLATMAMMSLTASGQAWNASLVDNAISMQQADGSVSYELPSQAPLLQGEPATEITLNLVYDKDSLGADGAAAIVAQSFTLLNEGNTKYFGRISNTDKSLVTFSNVPAGEYILYIQWHINDDGYSWRHYDGVRDIIIIKEGVVVDGNFSMTHDIAEAKNRLHFGRILPNGEAANPGHVTVVDGVSSYDGTENVYSESYFRGLYMKNRSSFIVINTLASYRGLSTVTSRGVTTVSDMSNSIDLYINDVSENIQLYNVYRAFWGENLDQVYITYDIKDGIDGDIDAQPTADFTSHIDLFQPTPRAAESAEHTPGSLITMLKGKTSQLSTMVNFPNALPETSDNYAMTSYFTSYATDGPGETEMWSLFSGVYNEVVTSKTSIMGMQYTYSNTIAPAIRFEDDGNYYNSYGIPVTNNLIYDTISSANSFVANPHFEFVADESQPVCLNSGCPILTVQSMNNVNNYGKRFAFTPFSIGRYGEYRQVDNEKLGVSIKYNDDEVCSSYADMTSFFNTFNRQGNPDGIINATFTNNNVIVDGIEGKNVCELEFDQTKDDWTSPTLTQLRFVDADGHVTDRFADASDGKVELTGADFNYTLLSTGLFGYNCKPVTMEVSYTPNGGDVWIELPVAENEDLYFYPAFGQLFEGALSAVNEVSANKWYDLKVRLADESGNWQEQIISPAFKLDNVNHNVAVPVLNADKGIASVKYYNVAGVAADAAYEGVNIVITKYADGTQKVVKVMK